MYTMVKRCTKDDCIFNDEEHCGALAISIARRMPFCRSFSKKGIGKFAGRKEDARIIVCNSYRCSNNRKRHCTLGEIDMIINEGFPMCMDFREALKYARGGNHGRTANERTQRGLLSVHRDK